jgi:ferrous iron transport protein A
VSNLAELRAGTQAKVLRVNGGDEVSQRLLEMGLTPGTLVRLLGAAPLGDPLELELRGYRLSVRKAEAARVDVDP